MKKLKKRYIVLISIGLIIGVLLFFLSSIVRWYVVKHSQELTGRKITIESIHFNYARVAIKVQNFVMFEKNGTDTFASAQELYVNFDPWNLIRKEYAFSEIRLMNPKIVIVQNGNRFNFDDLHPSADSASIKAKKDTTTSNVHFLIRNLRLSGGFIRYADEQVHNQVNLQNLDLEIPQIAWDSRSSDVGISFRIGEQGMVSFGAKLNNQKQNYAVTIDTKNLNLNILTNYLKSYMNISSLDGLLTSRIVMNGSMANPMNVKIEGNATIDRLSVTDNQTVQILTAENASTNIKEIDLARFHFGFSNITLSKVHVMAIMNKKSFNLMDFFQPYFRSDSIARSHARADTAASSQTPVTYSVDTFDIENSTLTYKDNTLNRPFVYDFKQIRMNMTGLTESASSVPISYSLSLNDRGKLKGSYALNMKNPMEIKTQMNITNLDVVSFSPYTEYYIASPVTQGLFNYNLSLEMSKTKLNNQNSVIIDKLLFGKRTHDKTAVKVPIRLALYILKDTHDKITFDIPVTGNPSEPQFSLKKLIWKTVGNFCVKVATEPFKAMSGLVSSRPEDINTIPFKPAQDTLDAGNRKTAHIIADLARKKPDLKFLFTQYTNLLQEKELIAINLAKTQFVRSKNPGADSATIANLTDKLALTNVDFKAYLMANTPSASVVEPEKGCEALIGDTRLDYEMKSMINRRNWALQKYLGITENLPEGSFRVETADLSNIPDELKTTMFKIEVALSE